MSLQIDWLKTKSGEDSVQINGVLLHSKYSPREEALRIIRARYDELQHKTHVLIIDPGIGYIVDAFTSTFPNKAYSVVFSSPISKELCMERFGGITYSDSPEFKGWFHQILRHIDIKGIYFLTWQPCLDLFATEANKLIELCNREMKKSIINENTLQTFQNHWEFNTVQNLLEGRLSSIHKKSTGLLLLCASGTTLSLVLPWIQQYRDSCTVWALPSSLAALSAYSIAPNVVIQTDGGFWSLPNLYNYVSSETIMISALRSRIPHDILRKNLFVPFVIEDLGVELYKGLCGSKPMDLPDNGTVAYQAILLALTFHQGPIVLAGLDLARRGIHYHVRPHHNDFRVHARSGKLNPVGTGIFNQARVGANHETSLGSGFFRDQNSKLLAETLYQFTQVPHIHQIGIGPEMLFQSISMDTLNDLKMKPEPLELTKPIITTKSERTIILNKIIQQNKGLKNWSKYLN